jgi:hypothetical protein
MVREPAGEVATKQPLLKMLGRVPTLLREDAPYRRYVRVRFLALASLLAEPFYAVHAIETLGAPVSAIGTFLILATFASIVANVAFRRPANDGRNVTVLQISVTLLMLAPIVATFATDWRAFAVVFALNAAGVSGMGVASWNLLYALAPEADRPIYIGLTNGLLVLPSLAPIVVGSVTHAIGYGPTFAIAAGVATASLAMSFRFVKLRDIDRQARRQSQEEAGT